MDGKEAMFLMYRAVDEDISVNALIKDESIWLSQKGLAELFNVQTSAISKHLKNIFDDGELDEKVVISKMETTTSHGAMEGKTHSINSELFHWQSQSTTAENSSTGQRYIHHLEKGSHVLLFVREFKADRITNGAEAYTYLGTANYVNHEGEKPMNITWRLDHPIPARYLKKTNKLVVG